ncbi:MAG: endonuclease/exonuclease/phosphatase family protein [Alphaproteobacteria bacterium]|nr:endonuclease/exonuclease/phosphatase family protein [Alphaproteobacteria bacterium]
MATTMRLVSFNILEGLRPVDPLAGERRLIDRDRAAAVTRVVADLRPDIMVVNEALHCRFYAGRKVDYADLLGFQHHVSALYDGAWGNAILSRFPISNSNEMRIYNRGGLSAFIETPMGDVTIASYHPHPRRYPENKAQDFVNLLSSVRGPLIVCGDFNCISPQDEIDRDCLIEACSAFSADPKATVDQFLKSGQMVFGSLAGLGLTDAIPPAGRRYSIPTDLLRKDKASGMRIDHVLANQLIEIVEGEVVHSEASNKASDHHPVTITFRIRR